MGHEWKIGDWAEYKGVRYFCYKCDASAHFVTAGGALVSFPKRNWHWLEHLPGCTGWDWKPAKMVSEEAGPGEVVIKDIPELLPGYRYLYRDEVVADGDLCIDRVPVGNKYEWRKAGGKSIGCTAGHRIDNYGVVWFARKIEESTVIEPPLGYRLISEGVVVEGDMSLQERGWYYSTAKGKDIGVLLVLGAAKAYARKIEETPVERAKIKPPPGYRLMTDEETIRHGDMFFQSGSWNNTGTGFIEISVGDALKHYSAYKIIAYARKIEPRYRPFANAAEFLPHRGKWVYFWNNEFDQLLICSFNDKGIWHAGRVTSWEAMFAQCKFEDGSPFGVLDELMQVK